MPTKTYTVNNLLPGTPGGIFLWRKNIFLYDGRGMK
jgi:hypothetical protein